MRKLHTTLLVNLVTLFFLVLMASRTPAPFQPFFTLLQALVDQEHAKVHQISLFMDSSSHKSPSRIACDLLELQAVLSSLDSLSDTTESIPSPDGSYENLPYDSLRHQVHYSLVCVVNNTHYDLDFTNNTSMIKEVFHSGVNEESKRGVQLSQAALENNKQKVIAESGVTNKNGANRTDFAGKLDSNHLTQRRLAKSKGKSTVLVLRVSYREKQPKYSAKQLQGIIFGVGSEAQSITLVNQINKCSFGKLRLVPAKSNGWIQNGVADVSVTDEIEDKYNQARLLETLATREASHTLGSEAPTLEGRFDHVIVVLPSGFLLNGQSWHAYSFFGSYRAVFNDEWVASLSTLMHQIGFNWYLMSAGKGNDPTGDITGYMGRELAQLEPQKPQSCFNAQNHWILGWYNDRSLSLGLDNLPWGGYLAAFADYDKTQAQQNVVIKIGESDPRLFLQYNRAKRMNVGTRSNRDEVLIVRDAGSSQYPPPGFQTFLEGGIALGKSGVSSTFRFPAFHGTRYDLVIDICNNIVGSVDMVRLSIHLDNGMQHQTCNDDLSRFTCDDAEGTRFFVDKNNGYKSCSWLRKRKQEFKKKLCVPSNAVYNICRQTCGQCNDHCIDTDKVFFVNSVQKYKNCHWLSSMKGSRLHFWKTHLCRKGQAAFDLCRESCNNCGGN